MYVVTFILPGPSKVDVSMNAQCKSFKWAIISFIFLRAVGMAIENIRESRDWNGPRIVVLLRQTQCILSTFSFKFSLCIYNYHSQDLFFSVNLQNSVLQISSLLCCAQEGGSLHMSHPVSFSVVINCKLGVCIRISQGDFFQTHLSRSQLTYWGERTCDQWELSLSISDEFSSLTHLQSHWETNCYDFPICLLNSALSVLEQTTSVT